MYVNDTYKYICIYNLRTGPSNPQNNITIKHSVCLKQLIFYFLDIRVELCIIESYMDSGRFLQKVRYLSTRNDILWSLD